MAFRNNSRNPANFVTNSHTLDEAEGSTQHATDRPLTNRSSPYDIKERLNIYKRWMLVLNKQREESGANEH
jgi:hypothetical protein